MNDLKIVFMENSDLDISILQTYIRAIEMLVAVQGSKNASINGSPRVLAKTEHVQRFKHNARGTIQVFKSTSSAYACERSGPAGGITLPIAPNNFAMAVLKTSKFVRKGIGRLDLG